jgi:hypothetical protein
MVNQRFRWAIQPKYLQKKFYPTFFPVNGVRVKTKRFKPTSYISTPDIAAFLEAATWHALRRLFMENLSAEEKV